MSHITPGLPKIQLYTLKNEGYLLASMVPLEPLTSIELFQCTKGSIEEKGSLEPQMVLLWHQNKNKKLFGIFIF